MEDPLLELAFALRFVEGWGWCGVAATEQGLLASTLAYSSEADCLRALEEASTAGRTAAKGPRRLRRRRASQSGVSAAGRTAYQLAGNGLEQLWEYLATGRQRLEAPLDLRAGTGFQLKTWTALRTVGFGETRTYAWVARTIGSERATRAVGTAIGTNPLLIFVPCHRVVGARGLGGFSRGIPLKRRLLDHEQAWPRLRMSV